MQLKDWLKKQNISARQFAKDNNIACMTIYMHFWKKRRMSVRMALKIEEITKGEVTAKEMVFYGE